LDDDHRVNFLDDVSKKESLMLQIFDGKMNQSKPKASWQEVKTQLKIKPLGGGQRTTHKLE
jgi:hypothetical protein